MSTHPKRTLGLAVAASLVLGLSLGWTIARVTQRAPSVQEEAPRTHQELYFAYGLLSRTLEDEAKLDTLSLLKTVTLDRPPDAIVKVMKQVSDAAELTLKQFDHYRTLPPRIPTLPRTGDFGDRLTDALKKDARSSLLERSPAFSKRLLLSQAQALGMLSVLAKELEKIEPNEARRQWLGRLSSDFGTMYDAYLRHLHFASGGQASAAPASPSPSALPTYRLASRKVFAHPPAPQRRGYPGSRSVRNGFTSPRAFADRVTAPATATRPRGPSAPSRDP